MNFLHKFISWRKRNKFFKKISKGILPDSLDERKKKVTELQIIAGDKLSPEECLDLIHKVRCFYAISTDRHPEKMAEYIQKTTDNKLNKNDAMSVFDFILADFFKAVAKTEIFKDIVNKLENENMDQKTL